jgi:hypothetical protein
MPSHNRNLVRERNDFKVGCRTADQQSITKLTPAQTGVSHFDPIPATALEHDQVKIRFGGSLSKPFGRIHPYRRSLPAVSKIVTAGSRKFPKLITGLDGDLFARLNIDPEIVCLFRTENSVEDRRTRQSAGSAGAIRSAQLPSDRSAKISVFGIGVPATLPQFVKPGCTDSGKDNRTLRRSCFFSTICGATDIPSSATVSTAAS